MGGAHQLLRTSVLLQQEERSVAVGEAQEHGQKVSMKWQSALRFCKLEAYQKSQV